MLTQTLIQTALDSLNDRWSHLYTPVEFKALTASLEGDSKGGLGLEVVADDAYRQGALVIDVQPNSPLRGQVHPGDVLLSVEEHSLAGVDSSVARHLLEGAPASRVRLRVLSSSGEVATLSGRRQTLATRTAYLVSEQRGTLHVRLSSFGLETPGELRRILESRKPETLVLDLRSNGGGYLDSAVDCAALFVAHNSLVSTVVSPNGTTQRRTAGQPVFQGRVSILVNEHTASAAELFSAALRHYRQARLIGVTTFGKGTVQKLITLPGGWAIKFTTAYYRTADGLAIDGKGLRPDQVVTMPLGQLHTPKDIQALSALTRKS